MGFAEISTLEFSVEEEQLCCVTAGSLWNCGIVQVNFYKITAEHHVKCCLRWLAKGAIVPAPAETSSYIRLSSCERETTHLTCICGKSAFIRLTVHGQLHIALYHAGISAYSRRNTGIDLKRSCDINPLLRPVPLVWTIKTRLDHVRCSI